MGLGEFLKRTLVSDNLEEALICSSIKSKSLGISMQELLQSLLGWGRGFEGGAGSYFREQH